MIGGLFLFTSIPSNEYNHQGCLDAESGNRNYNAGKGNGLSFNPENKVDTLCDLLAEAYPADKPSDTKSKVTEMANLMLKLKSAGYGTKDRPKSGSKES